MDSLFDTPAEVRAARDEAIERVDRHAPADWRQRALQALQLLCSTHETFTSDDLWNLLDFEAPPEPRALGAIFQRGLKKGWCAPTETYVQSKRAQCHGRPIRMWRSKLL